MPHRRIPIGYGPSTFDFQDEADPLVNGLGSAISTWLNTGRERAMIEMQRGQMQHQRDVEDARLGIERDSLALRNQEAKDRADARGRRLDIAEGRARGNHLDPHLWAASVGRATRDRGSLGKETDWNQALDFYNTNADAMGIPRLASPPRTSPANAQPQSGPMPAPPAGAVGAAAPVPEESGQGFWTMRRSGAPGGAQTLGDVLGGRWSGPGDSGPAAPAGPAPTPADLTAGQSHNAALIDFINGPGGAAPAAAPVATPLIDQPPGPAAAPVVAPAVAPDVAPVAAPAPVAIGPEVDPKDVAYHVGQVTAAFQKGDAAGAKSWLTQLKAENPQTYAATAAQLRAMDHAGQ